MRGVSGGHLSRLVIGLLPVAAPTLLVAGFWERAPWVSVIVVAASLVASLVARRLGRAWTAPIASSLPILGIAYLAVTATADPAAEALLGAAGLGAVVWIAVASSDGPSAAVAIRGLTLPALALAIALSVSLFLPVGEQSVGIAAMLLVGGLAVLAWAILRLAPTPVPEGLPPSL